MIFNSYIFLLAFLPTTVAGFWFLRGRTERTLWLLASSLAFYGYWNWRFLPFLLGSVAATYGLGLLTDRAHGRRRALALTLGVLFHLGLLGYFKYSNFFLSSFGFDPLRSLILPLGISFSAFQAISYLVDVYRKTISAERNILRFLAYGTLFPNIAAGPILRYKEISPDIASIGSPAVPALIHKGVFLLILGLAKKVLIADQIAELIDPLWATLPATGIEAWIATFGYGLQLYFDFSGYSDMAIGIGALFGLTIPQNFNSPYKALSPSDFWRRWHMTLGAWIKDYLYIPLGGSRAGTIRTLAHLIVIMTAIGLWHGANWTFVLWGAYHGALLALYHLARPWWDRLPTLLRRALTFFLITVGWTAFRSPDIASLSVIIKKMFLPPYTLPSTPYPLAFLILLLFAFLLTQFFKNTSELRFTTKKRAAVGTALVLVACVIAMNYKQAAFLYYQF